ncbi:hypothetical protein M8818_005770 [Zalaria obscura]|uniref:Uncharacterized protein n=1 Tax=Zalaria obscura TaxID=2024903 RepID=A0ACC3S9U9_9PEZI
MGRRSWYLMGRRSCPNRRDSRASACLHWAGTSKYLKVPSYHSRLDPGPFFQLPSSPVPTRRSCCHRDTCHREISACTTGSPCNVPDGTPMLHRLFVVQMFVGTSPEIVAMTNAELAPALQAHSVEIGVR